MDHVEVTLNVTILVPHEENAEESLQDIADRVADETTDMLRNDVWTATVTPKSACDLATGVDEEFE